MDRATIHNRRWAILAVLSLSVFLVTVDPGERAKAIGGSGPGSRAQPYRSGR